MATAKKQVKKKNPNTNTTTVIVVHGVHQHREMYSEFVRALQAAGYEAKALDLPGFGGNNGPVNGQLRRGKGAASPCSTANVTSFLPYARAVATAVRAARAKGGKVVVFGHSLGGLVATYAATLPEFPPLDGLILSSPSLLVHPDLDGCVGGVLSSVPFGLGANLTLTSIDPSKTTDSKVMLESWSGGGDPKVEGGLPLRMGYITAARSAQLHVREELLSPESIFRGEVLGNRPIKAPVLLLHGTLDRDVHDLGSCDALAHALQHEQATHRSWPVKHEVLFEFDSWTAGDGSNPALDEVLEWLGAQVKNKRETAA